MDVAEVQMPPGVSQAAPTANRVRVERQEIEIVTRDDSEAPGLANARGLAVPMGFRSPTKMGARCNILRELDFAEHSSSPERLN